MSKPSLRWAATPDWDRIVDIDRRCFRDWWDKEKWRAVALMRHTIIYVLEDQGQIRGYICYEYQDDKIQILNMAVDLEWWGGGYGKFMIDKAKSKLVMGKRETIQVIVNERSVGACCFFRSCGFKVSEILRQHFTSGDGYVFKYDLCR